MRSPAARVGRRAETQHGLVSLDQLRRLGITPSTLCRWCAAGRVERVRPRVYRVAGAPPTWAQAVMAAVLSTNGVASHRTAARLWGFGDHDHVEVAVPVARRGTACAGVVVHRSSDLERRFVTVRRGIPVTNPMRTLVDLGAVLERQHVSDALEQAVIARVCGVVAIERSLDRLARRGRRGAGVLRAVLDERALGQSRPDGLLEARFARLVREHGLPEPVLHFRVGRWVLDFAYPAIKLAIEVDGFAVHGTPRAFQHDLDRQNRLVTAGWTVLRFTWLDVVLRPERVAALIRHHTDG